jgi:hypothetical protein
MKIENQQVLLREKEVIDERLNEAMGAIRAGANSSPGLTRLARRQSELAQLLARESNAY